MLSVLALVMLATFTALVISGRASPLVALVLTPMVFALMGGFGLDLGPMMLEGVKQLAPTGVMLCFAILYFSIMSDAGLFDPLIRRIVKIAHGDPVRIAVGTAILALLVSMDGDGSTTYIICCSAMLPLYRRLGMNPLILACLLTLSCAITNMTPWGGPTARVASALNLDPAEVFRPLIPAMLAGAVFVIALGYLLGRRERKRLGRLSGAPSAEGFAGDDTPAPPLGQAGADTRRPRLLLFNLALTLALLIVLMVGIVPLPVLFIVATVIALPVNYPSLDAQTERLAAHAPNVLRVIAVIFAAGVFVGILNGTGMTGALAQNVVQVLPPALGPALAPVTSVLSIPFTFFMGNPPFHFGVVTVLSETAAHYGATPAEMARAALLNGGVEFLSPLTPSTHLLVALVGVKFAQHQRYTLPWVFVLWLVMFIAALLTGAIAVHG